MAVVVHIDKFSGPIALLLHLVRREEMDIFDININEITKRYLDSIKAMKKLDLEVAGDFIAMAATLIQIKSKMLLPQYNEAGEVVEQEDPRRDLVRRLLEYQMYQEAGQNLYKRELVGRNVWLRGMREEINVDDSEILLEEENALYALISCYRSAMKSMKKAVHRVSQSLQSIADRIWQMRLLLIVGQPTTLSALMNHPPLRTASGGAVAETLTFFGETAAEGPVAPVNVVETITPANFATPVTRSNLATPVTPANMAAPDYKGRLLITFLSLLELSKIGLTNIFQSENFADIHVETIGTIDRNAISKVENYESQVATDGAAGDIWLQNEEVVPPTSKVTAEEIQMSLVAGDEDLSGAPVVGDFAMTSVGSGENSPAIATSEEILAAAPTPRSVGDEPLIVAATDEEIEAALNEEFATDELVSDESVAADEVVVDADGATLTQLLAELGPGPVKDEISDLMSGDQANESTAIDDFIYPPKADEPDVEI